MCVCVFVCMRAWGEGGERTLFQLLTLYLFYQKGHHFSCCSWWDSSQVPRANTCVQPKSLSAFSRGGWQEGNVTFPLSLCNENYISHPTPKCKLSYHSAKPRIEIKIQADLLRWSATESQHNTWNKMVKNRYTILQQDMQWQIFNWQPAIII